MVKERESIIEKVNVSFQVVLTLGCFLGASFITQNFLKPVSWEVKQYKILFIIISPYGYCFLNRHIWEGLAD